MSVILLAAVLAVQSSDLRDADAVARLLGSLRTADPAVCELAGRSITNYGGWFGLTTEDPAGAPFCLYSLLPIALYALLVCTDSTLRNKSLRIGVYSIAGAFIQLIGYGTGFWRAWWNRCICGKDEFEAFKKNFYK